MQLNCKKGDLAVIVRSVLGQQGRFVTCLELFEHPLWPGEPCWKVDVELLCGAWCHDDQLKPIRDSDGEDEMLRIAGRPQERGTAPLCAGPR